MRAYINPEMQRYKYVVGRSLNEYAVMVLITTTGERVPLTKAVAAQNEIELPDGCRMHHSQQAPVQRELDSIAKLNGLVECNREGEV